MSDIRQVSQDTWLQRLQSSGIEREHAIEALRIYLVRGLERSLRNRYGGMVQVDDIVQMALLKILASIDTFQHRSRFETWAMSIATRVGISELRKRYYRDVSINLPLDTNDTHFDVVDPSANIPQDHAAKRRLLELLQQLIDEQLSDKQRLAIRGSLEGLPVEVIAARMQSNRNAVYKLVHDARLKLRQALEADGFTAQDILELIA